MLRRSSTPGSINSQNIFYSLPISLFSSSYLSLFLMICLIFFILPCIYFSHSELRAYQYAGKIKKYVYSFQLRSSVTILSHVIALKCKIRHPTRLYPRYYTIFYFHQWNTCLLFGDDLTMQATNKDTVIVAYYLQDDGDLVWTKFQWNEPYQWKKRFKGRLFIAYSVCAAIQWDRSVVFFVFFFFVWSFL